MYNFGVVMTEEEKKLLSTFETQLRHLMYLHDELKRENAGLRKLLENEKLKNEKVQAQYDELEVNYTNLKTSEKPDGSLHGFSGTNKYSRAGKQHRHQPNVHKSG